MIKNFWMLGAAFFYLAAAFQYFLMANPGLGSLMLCYVVANIVIAFMG